MVRLLKLAVALLAMGVLVGCLATESGDNSGGTASSGEVKFCLESLGGAGVSASVSGEATETTPASVALEYSTADGKETVSKTIELTPFGSGYITKKVISLDEGAYELTRFDVLDETGNTIYSTPTAGSDIATEVGIGTALSYRFTVAEGEINEIKMQVITVDDDTDPADFGHAAFTFEVVGYNRLYIDVLALIDSVGWEYVTAELSIADESGAVVKETDLNAVMNKVILPNSESYTLTISKAGYASQVFTLEQADFAQYKLKPLVVELRKFIINKPENVDYVVALDGSGDFTSIQTAIDTVEAGATIFVKDGTYNESVKTEKHVNIIGESLENTIVRGEEDYSFCLNTDKAFTMKNITAQEGKGILIVCSDTNYVNLKNVVVRDNFSAYDRIIGLCLNCNANLNNILVTNNRNPKGDDCPTGLIVSGSGHKVIANHVTSTNNYFCSKIFNIASRSYAVTELYNSIISGYVDLCNHGSISCYDCNTSGSGLSFKETTYYQLSDDSAGKGAASDGKDIGFIYPTE